MTRVAAIVGPTAVGKTAVSLEVARSLDAEIVSIDSMQMYRGMDIGTDKVSPAQRAEVVHHLIDVKDPAEAVSVAQFRSLARAAIGDIAGRGKLPLLVGGSGLYFRAVVDDLTFPPSDPQVRAAFEREVEELGTQTLYARLAELDPAAAARIEPNNARRIVRALEVIELTGRPFSQSAWEEYRSIYDLKVAGLERSREDLFQRIEARVRAQFERGLLGEVAALGALGRTARQALSYRQVLDAPPGTRSDEIEQAIVKATKRFARRQRSWFRADPRVRWFDASEPGVAGEVAAFLGGSVGA